MARDHDEDVARANRAAQLLQDDLLNEAFASVKTRILEEWEKSPARDTEGRERLWAMLRMLNDLRGHLTSVVRTGQMAKHKLAEIEDDKKVKRFPWQ